MCSKSVISPVSANLLFVKKFVQAEKKETMSKLHLPNTHPNNDLNQIPNLMKIDIAVSNKKLTQSHNENFSTWKIYCDRTVLS